MSKFGIFGIEFQNSGKIYHITIYKKTGRITIMYTKYICIGIYKSPGLAFGMMENLAR